jgi:predicted HTH transcriptional regulator
MCRKLGTGRSEIRNPVLAPIFKGLGLIEYWGTGIQRIQREVAEHGAVRLVLLEVGNAFQAQFVKTEVTTEVTPEGSPEAGLVPVARPTNQIAWGGCSQPCNTRMVKSSLTAAKSAAYNQMFENAHIS